LPPRLCNACEHDRQTLIAAHRIDGEPRRIISHERSFSPGC
jgi:hypothetical protein